MPGELEPQCRVQALQDRWDRMRKLIHERGIEMADVAGGWSTGLLVRDYKGKEATAEIYKVDTALLAELHAQERQAAEELGQWVTKGESSTINASEIIERLNAGRRRVREAWEKRQALAAGTPVVSTRVGAVPVRRPTLRNLAACKVGIAPVPTRARALGIAVVRFPRIEDFDRDCFLVLLSLRFLWLRKGVNEAHDGFLLICSYLGKHRQRYHARRNCLSDRQRSKRLVEMLITRLQMNRSWIVKSPIDAVVFQMLQQLVAPRVLNYVEMVNVRRLFGAVRCFDLGKSVEQFVIELCSSAARRVPIVQMT